MAEMDDAEMVRVQGQVLVRRFTHELQGNTPLEQETKALQKKIDEEEEARYQEHLESLYDELGGHASVFDGAEIAREALRQCCERLSTQDTPSGKESRFQFNRKPAMTKVDDRLRNFAGNDFSELKSMANDLEAGWNKKHSNAYRFFNEVCRTLDAHKDLFALFPSQGIYTSVFCGSLSLFLHAALNHELIADTLSRTVAEISTKAVQCVKLRDVIKTDSMKRRLAEVYTKVFYFFRDVMEWYLKWRISRFIKSFNDSVAKRFDEAAKTIQALIDEMYTEGQIGGLAMQRAALLKASKTGKDVSDMRDTVSLIGTDVQDIKAELFRQRQKPVRSPEDLGFDVGNFMRETLLSIFEEVTFKCQGIEYTLGNRKDTQQAQNLLPVGMTLVSDSELAERPAIPRSLALDYSEHLKDYIVGEDGIDLLSDRKYRLVESAVISKVQNWLSGSDTSQLLWISGPLEPKHMSSTRAASLAVIAAALQLEVPFISHLCEKPRRAPFADGEMQEKAGLIGLVYSMVHQLLQFNIEDKDVDVSEQRLQRLDGSEESWQESLSLLGDLLHHTPYLPYCVIHGLNAFEGRGAAEWCDELLDVLLQHQEEPEVTFNLLFTTSGQSMVLSRWIPKENRYQTTKTIRDVERRGKRLDLATLERAGSKHET